MNLTNIPRSLIYEDRSNLDDFGIRNEGSLNCAMYKLLRRHLYTDYGLNNYRALIIQMFNESYYLCTMFLIDKNADANFRDYIESVMINSSYPDNVTNMCRRMVYAMCYALLGKIATRSLNIRTIRRHLRNCSYEYMPMIGETVETLLPDVEDFAPVTLTEDLLSKIDWEKLTNDYDIDMLGFILTSLGRNKTEKQVLIISIYSSFIKSGIMSKNSYKIDGTLFRAFERYGGKQDDLVHLNEKNMLREKKVDLTSRITTLEQEKMNLLNKIRDLEIRNNVLAKDRATLEKKVKDLEYKYSVTYLANYNNKNNEEALRREMAAEMEDRMQKLQDKLGHTTVKLSSLVEGVKRYTKFRGLDAGKDIFFSLNYLLIKEPVWVENTEELENFFYEAEEKSKKALVEIENKQGGLIQIKKSE